MVPEGTTNQHLKWHKNNCGLRNISQYRGSQSGRIKSRFLLSPSQPPCQLLRPPQSLLCSRPSGLISASREADFDLLHLPSTLPPLEIPPIYERWRRVIRGSFSGHGRTLLVSRPPDRPDMSPAPEKQVCDARTRGENNLHLGREGSSVEIKVAGGFMKGFVLDSTQETPDQTEGEAR